MEEETKNVRVIINDVPFCSQRKDIRPEWKNRACTMACLKMAMEFVTGQRMPILDALYEEAQAIQRAMLEHGTITPKAVATGLLHDVVVNVAHNHGVAAHKEEFRSRYFNLDVKPGEEVLSANAPYGPALYNYGLKRIMQSVNRKSPVIVSVKRNFDPQSTNHSVLVVGYEERSGFYYHDPDSDNSESSVPKVESFVSLDAFKSCWRKLAIFADNIE